MQGRGTEYRDRDDSAQQNRARASKPTIQMVVIGALCLIAAVFIIVGITYSMGMWGGRAVADVVGMQASDAETVLANDGFNTSRNLVKSDETEGIVLSMNPAAAERIAEGSLITLDVATPRIVPNLVGQSIEQATKLLDEEGFANIEWLQTKSDDAEGTVIEFDPQAGTVGSSDMRITIETAVPYRVPDVVGMSEEKAVAAVKSEQFHPTTEDVYDEAAEEGSVVGTRPAAGEALASSSTVVIEVAKHRSTELVSLAWDWLQGSKNLSIGGISYEVGEVRDVSYAGDNTISYELRARPFESLSWLGIDTRYGNYETVRGTITWNDDDEIVSSDPHIERI